MDSLRQICQEAIDVLLDSGVVTGPSQLQMNDQRGIVRSLCLHQVLLRCKAELDQLRVGLKTLGILNAIEHHPTLFEPVFTTNGKQPLTPGNVQCSIV